MIYFGYIKKFLTFILTTFSIVNLSLIQSEIYGSKTNSTIVIKNFHQPEPKPIPIVITDTTPPPVPKEDVNNINILNGIVATIPTSILAFPIASTESLTVNTILDPIYSSIGSFLGSTTASIGNSLLSLPSSSFPSSIFPLNSFTSFSSIKSGSIFGSITGTSTAMFQGSIDASLTGSTIINGGFITGANIGRYLNLLDKT